MQNWLFKSEPSEFSIDDLKQRGQRGELWDGVRNYQARNFMRDKMSVGDNVLFYHSSCKHVGVAGVAKVIETELIDPAQFDENSKYFDPKASHDKPRWFCVRIAFVSKFANLVSLQRLKAEASLRDIDLLKRGNRLSILPVSDTHWQIIESLSQRER
ncbi:EVE domain-containing protein [Thalassotalea ponticola]|uniref:EVE domain-containing protein n=1 Tax=Thalassotalea ponticola TaxID=1523392 RepID=UPI0025B4F22F|nr:EVE domain-containing protein [Thalassotalea ponticola]MDN3653551.1 EVE domain-containing protein [Thalassotalea ponticola]